MGGGEREIDGGRPVVCCPVCRAEMVVGDWRYDADRRCVVLGWVCQADGCRYAACLKFSVPGGLRESGWPGVEDGDESG